MTIAEILRAGKARLLELGWCQGDEAALYADEPRKCCAATAIPLMGTDRECFVRTIAACDFLKKTIGLENGQLSAWNDDPERTLEDVLAAYDKAIAAAEAASQ